MKNKVIRLAEFMIVKNYKEIIHTFYVFTCKAFCMFLCTAARGSPKLIQLYVNVHRFTEASYY